MVDRPISRPVNRMTIDGQTFRKLKQIFGLVTKTIKRSRIGRSLLAGLGASAHSLGRVLHQLWLEVTGFTFLAIAAIGVMAVVREYGKYQVSHAIQGRLVLAVCFTVSFAWFGISSFWRVGRKKLKAKN